MSAELCVSLKKDSHGDTYCGASAENEVDFCTEFEKIACDGDVRKCELRNKMGEKL